MAGNFQKDLYCCCRGLRGRLLGARRSGMEKVVLVVLTAAPGAGLSAQTEEVALSLGTGVKQGAGSVVSKALIPRR